MKNARNIIKKWVITLHILIISNLLLNGAQAETLKFSTHTPPPLSSFVEDVLRHALAKNGLKLNFKKMPGRRVIYMVNNAIIDGDAMRRLDFTEISNDSTKNYRRVNEGIYKVSLHIVSHKDTGLIESDWDKINKGSVTYIRGSKFIRKNVLTNNRRPAETIKNIALLLSNKRVNSAVIFKSALSLHREKQPHLFKDLVINPKPVASFWLFPYLNVHKEKHILPLANAIRELKLNGAYNRLLEEHGLGELNTKTGL